MRNSRIQPRHVPRKHVRPQHNFTLLHSVSESKLHLLIYVKHPLKTITLWKAAGNRTRIKLLFLGESSAQQCLRHAQGLPTVQNEFRRSDAASETWVST
jgi:hypothetical protein